MNTAKNTDPHEPGQTLRFFHIQPAFPDDYRAFPHDYPRGATASERAAVQADYEHLPP
ncbi:MAG: hypothetical protein ACQEXQ_22420 [Bacillota bacterium]